MLNWLKKLFTSSTPTKSDPVDEQILALQTELQQLKLELNDRNSTLSNLQQQLQRQQQNQDSLINEAISTETEKLFNELASPVSQLVTQKYLLEVEGKPVQAKDIMLVVKRLVNSLENKGLTIVGSVGETISFEPNYHQPLSSNLEINSGEQVIVKIVGIAYQDKVIRKAVVEKLNG
jgi:molecular chaperone GrpE (heat shock protein)